MEDKLGIGFIDESYLVYHYWLFEVIIQGEKIMKYQFARIYNIEPLELFLDLPDIIDLAPIQKLRVKF